MRFVATPANRLSSWESVVILRKGGAKFASPTRNLARAGADDENYGSIVTPRGERKLDNQMHAHALQWLCWSGERLEETGGTLRRSFVTGLPC